MGQAGGLELLLPPLIPHRTVFKPETRACQTDRCSDVPDAAAGELLPHPDGLSKEALSDFTTPSPTTHRQVAWERDWRSSLLVATIKFLFTCPGPILLERGSLDSVPLSPGQETGWETDVLTWLLIATIRKLNFLTCIMVSNLRALLVFFFFLLPGPLAQPTLSQIPHQKKGPTIWP